jgi:hypothetical protein
MMLDRRAWRQMARGEGDAAAQRGRDHGADQGELPGGFLEGASHAGMRKSIVPRGFCGAGNFCPQPALSRLWPPERRLQPRLAAPQDEEAGVWARGADLGYDAAGRSDRATGWEQAAGGFEAAGLVAGGGGFGKVMVI